MTPDKKRSIIVIHKNPNLGELPPFLLFAQRQIEKTQPPPIKQLGTEIYTYQIPVDVLRLVVPQSSIEDIESIEISYRRPA